MEPFAGEESFMGFIIPDVPAGGEKPVCHNRKYDRPAQTRGAPEAQGLESLEGLNRGPDSAGTASENCPALADFRSNIGHFLTPHAGDAARNLACGIQ